MESSFWNRIWHVPCLVVAMGVTLVFSALMFGGCADGTVEGGAAEQTAAPCAVSRVRYPTTQDAFVHVYDGRVFYANGSHLGYDNALPEGAAIHPIACGTVRIFRPADGYGTLAVVVEHRLSHALLVRNGLGEQVSVTSFLSIYGHLRPTPLHDGGAPLGIRVGDTVGPDDVIGYVQNRADNGDGNEHLHLGVRLQSAADAMRTDASWFRGYDMTPSQRRWFADPVSFLATLFSSGAVVRWHPAGTLLSHPSRSDEWYRLGEDDALHPITPAAARADRLPEPIVGSDEEMSCYALGTPYVPELSHVRVMRFDDASAVYEQRDIPAERRAFISHEAFLSWGWRDADVAVRPARERSAIFAAYRDAGMRRLREGTLVKGRGMSEVAIVSGGHRLPIADWATFLAMGYRADQIVEINPATLDDVAYPRGSLITPELASLCHRPRLCSDGSCDAGPLGGGGIEDGNAPDASSPDADPPEVTSYRLTIELDASLQATCPGGWTIEVIDSEGHPYYSDPGRPFGAGARYWRRFMMFSAHCAGRFRDWAPAGRTAHEAGVASIRLNEVELANRDAIICMDPWRAAIRVAIPLDHALDGTCPHF